MMLKLFLFTQTLLILILLKSVPCHAQAEIAPDHFDRPITPGIQSLSLPATVAAKNQQACNFNGSFTLDYDVGYSGVTLTAGAYVVSIRSHARWDLVTLTRNGTAVTIRARAPSRFSGCQPIALIVERYGEQRKLAGIRMQKPEMVLLLESKTGQATPAESELVPISYVSRKRTQTCRTSQPSALLRGSRCSG